MVSSDAIQGVLGGTTLNTPEDINRAREFAYWQAMQGLGSAPFGFLTAINSGRGLENIARQQAINQAEKARDTTKYIGPLLPGGAVSANTLGQPNATASPVQKADVASVRNNNPGAQWPGPIASQYGATGSQNIAGGNKIATFADPVQGAAAQFALLAKNYAGIPLGQAIAKWSGGNNVQGYLQSLKSTGLSPNTVITPQLLASPQGLALVKAMAQHEAGKPFPLDDASWQKAQQLVFGGGQSTPATPGASLAAVPAAAQTQQAGASNLPGPQVSSAEAAQAWGGQQPQMNLGGPSPDASLGPGAGDAESNPNIVGGIDQNAPMGVGAGGQQFAQNGGQGQIAPGVPTPLASPRAGITREQFQEIMSDPRVPSWLKQEMFKDMAQKAEPVTIDMGKYKIMYDRFHPERAQVFTNPQQFNMKGPDGLEVPGFANVLPGGVERIPTSKTPVSGGGMPQGVGAPQPGGVTNSNNQQPSNSIRINRTFDRKLPDNPTMEDLAQYSADYKQFNEERKKEHDTMIGYLSEAPKKAVEGGILARSALDTVERFEALENKLGSKGALYGPGSETYISTMNFINSTRNQFGFKPWQAEKVGVMELYKALGTTLAATAARQSDPNPTVLQFQKQLEANPGLIGSPTFRRNMVDAIKFQSQQNVELAELASKVGPFEFAKESRAIYDKYQQKFDRLADIPEMKQNRDKTTVTKGKRGRLVQKPDGTTTRVEEVNGEYVEIPEGN